jgi:hypothetical protein
MPSPSKNRKKKVARHDCTSKPKAVAKKKASLKKKIGIPKEGVHRGVAYESHIEYYTIDWLEELKQRGYILDYYRAESFTLTESVKLTYKDSKGREKTQHLMHGSVYTPEFEVIWNPRKAEELVYIMGSDAKNVKPLIGHKKKTGEIYTILECKPDVDRNGSTRLWGQNMKVVYARYGIYVNLIQPSKFFERTFLPASYQRTPTGMERKIKFEYLLVDEYLTAIRPEEFFKDE